MTTDNLQPGDAPSEPTIADLQRLLAAHATDSAAWRRAMDDRMDRYEEKLKAHSEAVEIVRQGVVTWRVMTGVVKWLGAIALAFGSMWWAFKETVGHANGIGPTP